MQSHLFATHDGVELSGDLYLPQGKGPHPVVIAASGGGWLRGERGQLAHWGERLAAGGVAVFSADYRRSTDGKIFPQNAQDVLAAARFIDQQAEALDLDRDRMGMLGASAGAHLAALVALAGDDPLLADGYPDDAQAARRPRFKVLVGVYGVYDLPMHWRACEAQAESIRDDLVERMLGVAYPQDEALYEAASPVTHAHGGDPAMQTLLIYGEEDLTVLPEQSLRLAAALKVAGRPVTTLPVAEAAHFWFSRETDTGAGPNGRVGEPLIAFLQHALA